MLTSWTALRFLLIGGFMLAFGNYAWTVMQLLTDQALILRDVMGPYAAGRALIFNQNIYTTFIPEQNGVLAPYQYPPLFALLFLPLSHQSLYTASKIWVIANQIFFAVALWLSVRIVHYRFNRWQLILIAALALGAYPVYTNLKLGNVSMLLLMLIAAAYWLWQRNRPRWAALCLAVAICIKVVPAAGVVYLLWKREYRIAAYTILFTLLLLILPDVLLQRDLLASYLGSLTVILHRWHFSLAWFDNQSLRGMLSRFSILLSNTIHPWAALVSTVLSLTLAGLTLYLAPRSRGPNENATVLEYGLLVMLFPLASPNSWTHYYVWGLLLIPILVSLLSERLKNVPNFSSYGLIGMALVGFVLLSQPFRIPRLIGYNVEAETASLSVVGGLLQSLCVYGAILITLVVVKLLWEARQPEMAAEPISVESRVKA